LTQLVSDCSLNGPPPSAADQIEVFPCDIVLDARHVYNDLGSCLLIELGAAAIASARAACGAIGTFEAEDPGLDPGTEVAPPAVHPRALTISATVMPHFLWKATSATPRVLAAVRLARLAIAAIGGGLPRRPAGAGDVAVGHGQKALRIGRVAGLDDDIEDQAALAGDEAWACAGTEPDDRL
jgi:hypothetical protein